MNRMIIGYEQGQAALEQLLCEKLAEDYGLVHSFSSTLKSSDSLQEFDTVTGTKVIKNEVTKTNSTTVLSNGSSIVILVDQNKNNTFVKAWASSISQAKANTDIIANSIKPKSINDDEVEISFWNASQYGGNETYRKMDCPEWKEIANNYPNNKDLENIINMKGAPLAALGQLMLMHGPPGTGKTTAIRSLIKEWNDWCYANYIVDVDRFFGGSSDYMMDVLLNESYDEDKKDKYRLLILEDAGELLNKDAKANIGQGLSRFLNACDGMIGRGLKIIVLVTTNEPLGELHEAVKRPGRCFASVEVPEFTKAQANDWLKDSGHEVTESATLAELFEKRSGHTNGTPEKRKIGF